MLIRLLAVLSLSAASMPAHPPFGKEFEYEPGRYLTVLSTTLGWQAWKRESSEAKECVAAKPADGGLPLTFSDDGWVHGGARIYVWIEAEGETWTVADSTDTPLISAEWRVRGERFTRPFPIGRLFANDDSPLREINGPSPFEDGQVIEVTMLSREGHRTTKTFSLAGLDSTREILRRCRS